MSSSPPQPGPRGGRFRGLSPDERRARRRALLVDAGLQCFGTEGFHATGVRALCAEAGLSERYFYESFDNREALFLAVYEHTVQRIRACLEQAAATAPAGPEQLTVGVLRAYLQLLKDDPRLVRVGLVDVATVGAEMGNRALSVNRSFTDLIVPTIEQLCPDLEALGYDAQLVADGLLGSTLFLVTQWAIDGFRTPLETVLGHCAMFYSALLQSLE